LELDGTGNTSALHIQKAMTKAKELQQSYYELIDVLNSNIIDLMLCTSLF